MRLSAPLLLLLASAGDDAAAFAPSPSTNVRRAPNSRRLRLRMALSDVSDDAPKKKVLTAADVMAKSAAGGRDPRAPGEQDAPKLFSPAIYDDFQSALLTLEKRIKEGPGSLSADEVSKFEEEADRIIKEMREFMDDPKGVGESILKGYDNAAVVDVAPKKEAKAAVDVEEPKSAPPPPAAETAPAVPTTKSAPVTATADADPPAENIPPSEDEPTDAASSYGLAKGTTNTYILPGMEEMSGEEYRAKLQETISARQADRRKNSLSSNRGIIGNASSQGYLDGLSGVGGNKQGAPGNKQG